MVYKSSSIAATSGGSGGGGGGIQSINSDTTAAQLITAGSGISVSTSGGNTVITNTGSGAVSSVFGRAGAVSANYADYSFNLIGGTASVSQGGTGQTSLTSHAVLLGEGAVTGIGFATAGTAGRLFFDQGNADPAFKVVSGDVSALSTGAYTVLAVHGVTYPSSPSTNTVPVVTGSNTVTYGTVPNAALTSSAITINAQTGLAGGGSVALGSAISVSMGTGAANSLSGYNASGVFSGVSVGSNLSLAGGVLSATGGGGAVSSVSNSDGTLRINPTTGAVVASLASLPSANILVGSAASVATAVSMSGDVAIATSGATTIQANAVTTGKINNSAVTYAKIQNESPYTILGNSSATSAPPTEVTSVVIGAPGYAASGYNFMQFTTNQNSYAQISLQNSSAGSSASVDFILTANDGSDTLHFADFGKNNSVTGSAAFTNPRAAYLYDTDNELDIASLGSTGTINFYTTGGVAAPVRAGFFDSSQRLNLTNGTQEGLLYFTTATAVAATSAGLLGQFLQSNGNVSPPTYATLAPVGNALFSNTTVPGGNTVSNTTSPTAFTSSYTIAANSLNAGDILKVRLYGVYSTTGIAPTIQIQTKFGSTVMLSTGALTTVTGVTNGGWWGEGEFVVQTIGAGGTIESQGYGEFSTAATTGLSVNMTNTAAIAIDTTASQAITVVVTWGTAAAGNTITCREFTVEKLTTAAGPVTSILNSDGSLTISPTTGNSVASLNVTHANAWTDTQTFNKSNNAAIYITNGSAQVSAFSNGNSGTAALLSLNNSNTQTLTISNTAAISLTAPSHPGHFSLIVTQDATGHPYSISGVKWVGKTTPTYSSGITNTDIFSFLYDGTNIWGVPGINFG